MSGRALWVPLTCVDCDAVKHNASGQPLYHDLLAQRGWTQVDGWWVPMRPTPYRCGECTTAREAFSALGREEPRPRHYFDAPGWDEEEEWVRDDEQSTDTP